MSLASQDGDDHQSAWNGTVGIRLPLGSPRFEMTALHSIGIGVIFVLTPGVILLGLILWYTAEGSKD
jgi:hypothetical protein